MRGALRHPPATATGTPRPPFARERYQMLAHAALAPKPRHAVFEHAARQKLPELALDELRQARAVAGPRHRAQEGLQVLRDDPAEHRARGITAPVHLSLERHGPPGGAPPRLAPC